MTLPVDPATTPIASPVDLPTGPATAPALRAETSIGGPVAPASQAFATALDAAIAQVSERTDPAARLRSGTGPAEPEPILPVDLATAPAVLPSFPTAPAV